MSDKLNLPPDILVFYELAIGPEENVYPPFQKKDIITLCKALSDTRNFSDKVWENTRTLETKVEKLKEELSEARDQLLADREVHDFRIARARKAYGELQKDIESLNAELARLREMKDEK